MLPNLVGCLVAEDAHGGVVDLLDDGVELVLGQVVEAGALGQVAADPPVAVLVASPLPGAVGVGEVGGHAQGLVDQPVAGRLAPVVPGAVDAQFGRDPPVDAVLGPGRGHGALVGDEAGEQLAAGAFDMRVDAPAGRGHADHGVGLPMTGLQSGIHRLGTLSDGHAHGDAWPLHAAPPSPGAVASAPWQVLAQAQGALGFGVDPLVEAFMVFVVRYRWSLSSLVLDGCGVHCGR